MSEINTNDVLSEDILNTDDLALEQEFNTDDFAQSDNVENEIMETENLESEEVTETLEEEEDPATGDQPTTVASKKVIKTNRITELPISKIKHIIKLDEEVKLVNGEAAFLVTKATELFIKNLSLEAYNFALQNKKKTITKNYVDSALNLLPVELL